MSGEDVPVYAGFAACGCCVAVTVDKPERAAENAKIVAEWIADGLVIERKTVGWVWSGGLTFCQHKVPNSAAPDNDLFGRGAA